MTTGNPSEARSTVAGLFRLPGFSKRNLPRELLAGITLMTIAVPLNIGYAQIAGLPPSAGLYALIIPTVVYALVVSSRQVVASPDAAAAALVASSLGGLAAAGSDAYLAMALAQAIICGVVMLLMSVFRLGFLAAFLSEPILVGFISGLALEVLVSQIAKMLGIHLDPGGEFVSKVIDLVAGIPHANIWAVSIAAVSLVVLLGPRRKLPRVPWPLVVLVAATVVVASTDLTDRGVSVLGEIPSGPPVFTWPQLGWLDWIALVPSALALAMVATVEGLLIARSYAERHGYPVSPDRDLAAFGLSNVAAGLTGGFAIGSSTSRTAAMEEAGSRSQLPSLVMALTTLALLLCGTGLLADIPSAAIGAIISVAVVPLLGVSRFVELWRLERFEFGIAVVCFGVTVLVGPIPGILVAVVLAFMNLARRVATPAIEVRRLGGAQGPDGVTIVRMSGPLFFANADVFARTLKSVACDGSDSVRSLLIDMGEVTDVDVTAAESFQHLRSWLVGRGIDLAFARPRGAQLLRLRRLGVIRVDDRVFATVQEAEAALRGG
ncbi:SulP family inorganic anion transporter [Gordonia neofelifaecis]|uniref:Sulfate permease-like transporter n=1 Tax=Gordonia neofelifaecis NRRL B-59395 TaxID=644548 RepID=F1YNN7_9ACTN|nr:SulP family inorganic anion transporter [Gordonia neofelifaecis]EGD53647.1 sulfate permease-like transporter [Gordonia neofelifaecis NRRL B-59395]